MFRSFWEICVAGLILAGKGSGKRSNLGKAKNGQLQHLITFENDPISGVLVLHSCSGAQNKWIRLISNHLMNFRDPLQLPRKP